MKTRLGCYFTWYFFIKEFILGVQEKSRVRVLLFPFRNPFLLLQLRKDGLVVVQGFRVAQGVPVHDGTAVQDVR